MLIYVLSQLIHSVGGRRVTDWHQRSQRKAKISKCHFQHARLIIKPDLSEVVLLNGVSPVMSGDALGAKAIVFGYTIIRSIEGDPFAATTTGDRTEKCPAESGEVQ
jgi:hypothetical protein